MAKITAQYGDLFQGDHYGKLAEHMTFFAKRAEAVEPGGSHELFVPASKGFTKRDPAVIQRATAKFYEAIETLRSVTHVEIPGSPEVHAGPGNPKPQDDGGSH